MLFVFKPKRGMYEDNFLILNFIFWCAKFVLDCGLVQCRSNSAVLLEIGSHCRQVMGDRDMNTI